MTTRTKILEACVRSRLLYSVQAWELYAFELRKMVAHGLFETEALKTKRRH